MRSSTVVAKAEKQPTSERATSTSFAIDDRTGDAIEKLKRIYGVNSTAAVIKKSIVLALLASKQVDEENCITLYKEVDDDTRVLTKMSLNYY